MNRPSIAVLIVALAIPTVLTGCRGQSFWAPPGPLKYQQDTAVIHDPYPQNDIAPYEAASRPPSYQNPLAEPVRNRILRDSSPANGW